VSQSAIACFSLHQCKIAAFALKPGRARYYSAPVLHQYAVAVVRSVVTHVIPAINRRNFYSI
jgi:hypothetical protein